MTVRLATVKEYEELDGGQGREVFFRPQRYRAQDLAPLRGVVVLRSGGDEVECAIHDVSQNGVAFEYPADQLVQAGAMLAGLELRFDGHVAWKGEARVGSVREQEGARVVGVAFGDFFLDVDELLELRRIKAARERHGPAEKGRAATAWHVRGHEKFKALVSELRLYLEDGEEDLARLEKDLAWHVLHGDSSPARAALVDHVRTGFAAEVISITEEIDAAIRSVPPPHLPALKEYSRRHLHDTLMQSPSMHRAFSKPFGYPGDYEVMRFIYERNFEGPTLFAKALSLAFDGTRAAAAVRCRKDLIKRQLRDLLESRRGTGPVRILSVASGPAQELWELLHELEELPTPLEIVLFEQDKGALAYAYRRLRPAVEERFPGKARVLYLHDSIKRLLRDKDLFAGFGPFDALWSSGLFDYLKTSTAVVLARNLFSHLKPGGAAWLANMAPENPSRWYMEHHLDWYLIHRTRTELESIGQNAAPGARTCILEEESGVNPFVEIRKG